ncbi:MAG: hypothetical protein HOC20_07310 [Chloroflexi bacterium]|jgi:hypothetical protein|nr:hypothetical protein [Chloroflexota bacterium]
MRFGSLIRKAHVFCGIALLLPLILFAVSGFILNHRWSLWETWDSRQITEKQVTVNIAPDGTSLDRAQFVLEQLGIKGEVNTVFVDVAKNSMQIRAQRPGKLVELNLALDSGSGTLVLTDLGFWFIIRNLHTMSGLHSNLAEKKNWVMTRVWSMTMDLTAVVMALLVLSGLFMWYSREDYRKSGLIILILGAGVFFVTVAMMVLL